MRGRGSSPDRTAHPRRNAITEYRSGDVGAVPVVVGAWRYGTAQRIQAEDATGERRMRVGRITGIEPGIGDRDDLAGAVVGGSVHRHVGVEDSACNGVEQLSIGYRLDLADLVDLRQGGDPARLGGDPYLRRCDGHLIDGETRHGGDPLDERVVRHDVGVQQQIHLHGYPRRCGRGVRNRRQVLRLDARREQRRCTWRPRSESCCRTCESSGCSVWINIRFAASASAALNPVAAISSCWVSGSTVIPLIVIEVMMRLLRRSGPTGRRGPAT